MTALKLRPDFAEAHSNRGDVLHKLNRFDDALASCDRALALRQGYAEAHCYRSNALHALGRLDEALASHNRALALRLDYAEEHSGCGNALRELNRFAKQRLSCRSLFDGPGIGAAFLAVAGKYCRASAVRP